MVSTLAFIAGSPGCASRNIASSETPGEDHLSAQKCAGDPFAATLPETGGGGGYGSYNSCSTITKRRARLPGTILGCWDGRETASPKAETVSEREGNVNSLVEFPIAY